MRIVMPLFDFYNEGCKEYVFSGGRYSLCRFNASNEIPQIELFSEQDVKFIEIENWALVAEGEGIESYKEEVNLLLLSFRIYRQARVFIKYRLCKENVEQCSRLNDFLHIVMPDESNRIISFDDLNIIDKGFSKLQLMKGVSDRTRNAIYFMYRGLCSGKMIDAFLLLMCAIEALFSKEQAGGATTTICSRVSKFLGNKAGYEYQDIKGLYRLRSNITHGRVVVGDEIKGYLETLYKLQYILLESMKKMLDENIYPIYSDPAKKETYLCNL